MVNKEPEPSMLIAPKTGTAEVARYPFGYHTIPFTWEEPLIADQHRSACSSQRKGFRNPQLDIDHTVEGKSMTATTSSGDGLEFFTLFSSDARKFGWSLTRRDLSIDH